MNTLLSNITAYAQHHNLVPTTTTIILGLSGGPDSVFLVHVMAHLRSQGLVKNIIAAHLDHQWRENSGQDVLFCRKIAEQYNVEFVHSKLADLDLTDAPKGSKEEIGRYARRLFFNQLATLHAAEAIALAHHRNDQQETFFLRLIRGTSLSGLIGIRPRHGLYIRPLLATPKSDILAFLDAHTIPYLIDPTNTSTDFLRNRIRMHVIPTLTTCDARFDTSFERTLTALQETEEFLEDITASTFTSLIKTSGSISGLDIDQLRGLHPALGKRIIIFWLCKEQVKFPVHRGLFDEIIKFLTSTKSTRHQIHPTWSIVRHKRLVYLQKHIR